MQISKPIVFFDLETTGKNPEIDRIVEIAVIKINLDGQKEEKRYLLNPNIEIPPEATLIHGITNEMVADRPTFKQISKALFSYLSDCDLAGYNSDRFDIPLLSTEFQRVGLIYPNPGTNQVDAYKLYTYHYPNTLEAVYERIFGDKLDGAHGAHADTNATVKILFHLLDKFYSDDVTPQQLDDLLQGDKKRVDNSQKLYRNSAGEVCWAFGPNKDSPVLSNLGFLNWVLSKDFPEETKGILRQLIINS